MSVTPLAALIQRFFIRRRQTQRGASPHTVPTRPQARQISRSIPETVSKPQVYVRCSSSACLSPKRAWNEGIARYLQDECAALPPQDSKKCFFGLWMEAERRGGRGSQPGFLLMAPDNSEIEGAALSCCAVSFRCSIGSGNRTFLVIMIEVEDQNSEGNHQHCMERSPSSDEIQSANETSKRENYCAKVHDKNSGARSGAIGFFGFENGPARRASSRRFGQWVRAVRTDHSRNMGC